MSLSKVPDSRMSANAARLAEAQECERKAAECLKTSMIKLKFKPDFDGAATALERASVCYRNVGDIQKASKSLIASAHNYEQNGNMFHAAKAREGAAMLLRESGDFAAAFPLFKQAIEGYALCGSMDTAAMTVEKAAKVISKDEPEKAIELYWQGLELVQQDDRTKLAGEFLSQITRLNLVMGKYPEASKSIQNEITKYADVNEYLRVGQLAIGLVLVHLALEDAVAAEKWYGWVIGKCPNFEHTDDARACRQLILSYSSGDNSVFQDTLKSGTLRSMNNEFLRLQKKLKVVEISSGPGGDVNEDEDDLR